MRAALDPLLDEMINAAAPALAEAHLRAAADGGHYMPNDIARVFELAGQVVAKHSDGTASAQALHELGDRLVAATLQELNREGRLHAPLLHPGTDATEG